MDNLRVHHTKVVKEKINDLGWEVVFNAAYSSEIHCIETVFTKVKRTYRKEILKKTGKVQDFEHKEIIERSIDSVGKETVVKVVDKFEAIWRDISAHPETWN